jgi:AraC family transcriptional regulator
MFRDLDRIQKLVGNITGHDLEHVDCAVCTPFGVFVPSTGYCRYAVTENHTHPGYMFIIFVNGEQHIVEPAVKVDKDYFLACALSPLIPHTEKMEGGFNRYYAVVIEREWFEKIYRSYTGKLPPRLFWYQFEISEAVVFYLRQFINEYENDGFNSDAVLSSLAAVITHTLVRAVLHSERENKPADGEKGMEKTVEYMEQHFGEKLTVRQLADTAHLSVPQFDRKFRHLYGKSPFQYLTEVRVSKAKRLLKKTDASLTETAYRCGFSSPANFTSIFKKYTGAIPSAYRNVYNRKND